MWGFQSNPFLFYEVSGVLVYARVTNIQNIFFKQIIYVYIHMWLGLVNNKIQVVYFVK